MQFVRRGSGRSGVQSPIVFYGYLLLHALLAGVLFMLTLLPLGALVWFAEGSPLRWLSLLSPVLFIFIVMPLRFSFAQALSDHSRGIPFSLQRAFGFSLYGEKLAEGVVYLLHMLKWAIPMLAFGAVLYVMGSGDDEFTKPVAALDSFGRSVTVVWQGITNFIKGLFGGTQSSVPGGLGEGVVFLLIIAGICVLLFLLGMVRNSAYRYIWAEATLLDKNPKREISRSLRRRRWQQLLVALVNLLLLSPVLIVLYQHFAPRDTTTDFLLRVLDLITGEGSLPELTVPFATLSLLLLACWLPLAPVRRILTSRFATARLRSQNGQIQNGTPSTKDANPPLYQDTPIQGERYPR